MNTRSHTKAAAILGCINKINNISSSKEEMKREKGNKDLKIMNPMYPVDINFDEASSEWHANKRRIGHEYVYICLEPLSNTKDNNTNGKVCGKKCYQSGTTCFIHRKRNQSK